MIFDMFDYEFLKLCGLCRYMPVGLQKRYDAPFLSRGVISNLREHGFVKTQSDRLSYKLTFEGRKILAEMGYNFPDDTRMDLKRPAYKRKLKNALWNVSLYLAGIDIYSSKTKELAEMETGYISSLTLRADKNIRVLAGTRFLGILRIRDTAYIPYYLENENDWIIPGYEREIFKAQIEAIQGIKEIRIILTGNSLEELWACIHPESETEKLSRGKKRFDAALEELGYDYLLVPFNRDGVVQLGFLKSYRNRERLAKAIGCDTRPIRHLSECDGVLENVPYIIAIDFQVNRIVRALKQIELYDHTIVPKICCLPFQKSAVFKLLQLHHCQKCVVITIDKNNIYDIFPEFKRNTTEQEPYMTKEGKYIDAVNKKNKKADVKE